MSFLVVQSYSMFTLRQIEEELLKTHFLFFTFKYHSILIIIDLLTSYMLWDENTFHELNWLYKKLHRTIMCMRPFNVTYSPPNEFSISLPEDFTGKKFSHQIQLGFLLLLYFSTNVVLLSSNFLINEWSISCRVLFLSIFSISPAVWTFPSSTKTLQR